jgi:hypothetical protein
MPNALPFPMTNDQLRQVLQELDGERELEVSFVNYHGSSYPGHIGHLALRGAMLIPDEPDHMVKVTDGKSIYILESQNIAYIRIGLKKI